MKAEIEQHLAETISRLFLGSKVAAHRYGVQQDSKAAYHPGKGFLHNDLLLLHLQGEKTLSIQLPAETTCLVSAGCLDLDLAPDLASLQSGLDALRSPMRKLTELGVGCALDFSGRRGFHLWVFSEEVTAETMRRFLKAAANHFNIKADIYPKHNTPMDTDGIKVPPAFHKWSGQWSLLLPPDADGVPLLQKNAFDELWLQSQIKILEGIEPTRAHVLIDLIRQLEPASNNKQAQKAALPRFERLMEKEHPPCISMLLTRGVPSDMEYNTANLTIARYALDRAIAGEELAVEMAKNSKEHPTTKDDAEKVRNFSSVLGSLSRQGCGGFQCSYIWHNDTMMSLKICSSCKARPKDPKNEDPGLMFNGNNELQRDDDSSKLLVEIGTDLFCYLWQHPEATIFVTRLGVELSFPFVPKKKFSPKCLAPLALSTMLPALSKVLADGVEVRRSTIMMRRSPWSENVNDILLEWTQEDNSHLEKAIDALIERAETCESCKAETFELLLTSWKDYQMRREASSYLAQSRSDFGDKSKPLSDVIQELSKWSLDFQRESGAGQTYLQIECLSELYAQILEGGGSKLSTGSTALDRMLHGGWKGGNLYVIAAPPGGGKTTFCAWTADAVNFSQIPVLYVSYEMSRVQLTLYGLSRAGELNSGLIESRKWADLHNPQAPMIRQKLNRAAEIYNVRIAPYLAIIEASTSHTPALLKGLILELKHRFAMGAEAPLLVVIDYLQLVPTGEAIDNSPAETIRVSRVSTSLKQLARDTNTAILAISDITKEAYKKAMADGCLDMSALRDSFKIAHAADGILLLQTDKIRKKGDDYDMDQWDLAADRWQENTALLQSLYEARGNTPVDSNAGSVPARMSVLKNRGGPQGQVLLMYDKAYHRYRPVDLGIDLPETIGDEA